MDEDHPESEYDESDDDDVFREAFPPSLLVCRHLHLRDDDGDGDDVVVVPEIQGEGVALPLKSLHLPFHLQRRSHDESVIAASPFSFAYAAYPS